MHALCTISSKVGRTGILLSATALDAFTLFFAWNVFEAAGKRSVVIHYDQSTHSLFDR